MRQTSATSATNDDEANDEAAAVGVRAGRRLIYKIFCLSPPWHLKLRFESLFGGFLNT